MTNPGPDECFLFGIPVQREGLQAAVERVDRIVRAGGPVAHVVLNAAKVSKMASDREFAELIGRFDVVHADGSSIVLASRLLGDPLPERVAGIDLMSKLVELSAERGYRPYFLGARQEILERCVQTLRQEHPTLEVAGQRNGYWCREDPGQEERVVAEVRSSGADILFVAIPTPYKETFLIRHRAELGVSFAMGVGGAFDVIAGSVKRAPLSWQHAGMEWLYRLIQEPRRMWRRYLLTNTHFAWLLVKELLQARGKRRTRLRTGKP